MIFSISSDEDNQCKNNNLTTILDELTEMPFDREEHNITILVDSQFPIYKSSIFFSWKWPYLSPVGPSGRFVCVCPTQSQAVRPVQPNTSIHFY